jgi:6-phosphogluconolactonase
MQTIAAAPDFAGKSGAEIAVHPSGKFLYAANRGHNSIAIFTIDSKGKLTAAGNVPTQGKTPRFFGLDPTGAYLIAANQDSDNIVVFKIDQKTGGLTPTGDVLEIASPVCVAFVPAP